MDKWKISSKTLIKEKGDSVVAVERRFPADGVSEDPRTTCWWLSTLSRYKENKNLDNFLREATVIKNSKDFENYLADLKKKVLSFPGKTDSEKVVNYTALIVKGSPKKWDAWQWPGYYK